MATWKSSTVATTLGISYCRLFGLLRAKKVCAPTKDASGDYLWNEEDLAAARKALAQDRRRKEKRQ